MHHLSQYPTPLILLICVVLFSVPVVVGTYLIHTYRWIKYLRAHNEVVSFVFAIVGGFYGLILGFVVLLVWESFNEARNNADLEASLARGLYRDISYYPQPCAVKDLKTAYMTYIHSVVEIEYPKMLNNDFTQGDYSCAFNTVFLEMEKLNASDPKIEQMFSQLNELETYRGLRQLNAIAEVWPEVWVPILLGGGILLFFALLIEVESLRLHITVNGLLGTFIGLVIYMIVLMNQPFTGSIRIKPDAYETILKIELLEKGKQPHCN